MSPLESPRSEVLPIPRITRQFWVMTHRHVGLAIWLFVFNLGLTGALLSFNQDFDDLLPGDLAQIELQGAILTESALLAVVTTAYPGATVEIESDPALKPTHSVMLWLVPTGDNPQAITPCRATKCS